MNRFRVVDNYLKQRVPNGPFELNAGWRKYVIPSFLYLDLSDVSGVYTVAASGSPSRLVSFKQPYSSAGGMDVGFGTPFEIKQLVFEDSTDGTAAAAFTVMLRELGETRLFMNRPIHVRALFGTGQYPAKLRESYMMFSQHNIQMECVKLSGSATTIRPYLAGAQYFPWAMESGPEKETMIDILSRWRQRRKYVWPFWQTTDTEVSLTANQTLNVEAKLGEDSHFQCEAFAVISTGNFAYEICEAKTGRSLMNGQATKNNSLGDARLPTILPVPYVVPAGYRLKFTFKDLSGSTNNVYFAMVGKRIYAPLKDVVQVQCDTEVTRA